MDWEVPSTLFFFLARIILVFSDISTRLTTVSSHPSLSGLQSLPFEQRSCHDPHKFPRPKLNSSFTSPLPCPTRPQVSDWPLVPTSIPTLQVSISFPSSRTRGTPSERGPPRRAPPNGSARLFLDPFVHSQTILERPLPARRCTRRWEHSPE